MPDHTPAVLTSWKEIAAYLRTSVRTVQRWERSERLPVHRHEHIGGPTVYALKSELDSWLASRSGPPGIPVPPARPWRRYLAFLAAALAVLAATALYFLRPAPLDSLAVLPFSVEGSDPDTEYLGEGLPESISRGLSRIPGFRVRVLAQAAVARANGKARDAQQAGRFLQVPAVLTGRIALRGNDLRVSVELIRVEDNTLIWGERFDRNFAAVLELQEQIAREIAARLHLRLTSLQQADLRRQPTASPVAHRSYLLGRYHWNRRTAGGLDRAISYFQQAIAEDPAFALAYAGLAECYAVQSYYAPLPPGAPAAKGLAAARKALELDPELSEAWNALAYIESDYEWRWNAAEQHFRRAIELDSNNAAAHHWFSELLAALGRFREQRQMIERASALDPLSPIIANNLGHVFYFTNRHHLALDLHRKAALDFPGFGNPHQDLGKIYLVQGNYRDAIAQFISVRELGGSYLNDGWLVMAFARSGDRTKALEMQSDLLVRQKTGYLSPYLMALVSLGLGEHARAFDWLDRAAEERSQTLRWLSVDPLFDPLRAHPRFRAILQRMNLPDLPAAQRHE